MRSSTENSIIICSDADNLKHFLFLKSLWLSLISLSLQFAKRWAYWCFGEN